MNYRNDDNDNDDNNDDAVDHYDEYMLLIIMNRAHSWSTTGLTAM